MADDYDRGRRDGLRLALQILASEEAKWEPLLGQSPSWRTNLARETRYKTLQVAQTRVQTSLNRLRPADDLSAANELAIAIEKAGL
ncbi:hypothetical protein [Sphingomonas sp.]|uniref:hypothetical protein n=1 Tax=Sphingomonas sp. TaxID=28214 RepID=UPI0017B3E6FD|nr:hypothetical protein [Sphingomonas sp.]MBA4762858.1 hypothetical protein [Sphingomonas sp.]